MRREVDDDGRVVVRGKGRDYWNDPIHDSHDSGQIPYNSPRVEIILPTNESDFHAPDWTLGKPHITIDLAAVDDFVKMLRDRIEFPEHAGLEWGYYRGGHGFACPVCHETGYIVTQDHVCTHYAYDETDSLFDTSDRTAWLHRECVDDLCDLLDGLDYAAVLSDLI